MRGVLLGLLLAGVSVPPGPASAATPSSKVASVAAPAPGGQDLPSPVVEETPQAQEARARLHVQREFERVGGARPRATRRWRPRPGGSRARP
ncbi:hypothetical protein [Corallococcus sp. 4LFB]|uniref:hypothetical protein n=1 Tax=Corallococcus sp. 4LFB TaxID=3383249 RepID=UPI0039768E3D